MIFSDPKLEEGVTPPSFSSISRPGNKEEEEWTRHLWDRLLRLSFVRCEVRRRQEGGGDGEESVHLHAHSL